jgi:hypothetical protein
MPIGARSVVHAPQFIEKSHIHPYFKRAEMDEVYEAGEKHAVEDMAEFERRAKVNLPH